MMLAKFFWQILLVTFWYVMTDQSYFRNRVARTAMFLSSLAGYTVFAMASIKLASALADAAKL